MANTFKFGNGNWAVKDGSALAYNDENNNFKPLPFDFTRASSATRVNKQGLIETVPSGKPRIDFTDNTNGHLLLEPSRTNIITNSEQFVDAPTGNTNMDLFSGTITNNNTTSPDGNTKGMKYTISSGSGATLRIYQSDLSTSADTTFTIYAKKGTANSFSINISGGTATSVTLTDEWQRITTTDTSNSNKFIDVTVTGSVGQYIYIFGMQAEAASYATSYIPTEGSSATRVAETGIDCLLPNETIINNSTATVYLEFEALVNDLSNRWISFEELGVPTDNMFEIRLSAGSNLLQIVTRSSGGGQDVVMSETLTDITANNKIAVNYNGLNWKLAVNGTIADTETAARLFNDNIEKIKFSRNTNTNHFYGKVKDLRVYNTALTDTELQNLTS